MPNKKKIISLCGTMCLSVFLFCFSFAVSSVKTVHVIKENSTFSSTPLFLVQGMGYLSTDDIAKIYGAKPNWLPLSKKVILTLNNKEIIFQIGSKRVIVDKIERLMNKKALLDDSKLLIPLEFVLTRSFADVTGFYSEWDYRRFILRVSIIPDIFSPRYYSYKDKTRLVIQAVEGKEIQIDSSREKKIAVKIYRSKINAEKSSITINDGVVDSIDATNLERDVLFVVNLGTYSGRSETFILSSPFRFVIDVERIGEMSASLPGLSSVLAPSSTGFLETNIPSNILPPEEEIPIVETDEIKKSKPTKTIHKFNKIVVDAGHGGEDPGAIGQKGTKEKDINLIIAQRLKDILKKNGYEVFLTRADDTFIPLADRTRLANKVMADLFVSIHCNASISADTRGFEIYFLSEKATDRAAEAVANMENSVIALEKSSLSGKRDIEKLLLSMAVTEFMNESSSVCGLINQEICKNFSNLDSRGVKQANFYVLRGATMPAVLVEVGFLSNAKEEKLLNQKKFQKKITENIFNGIKEYEKRLK
ncbi:MAG: N-acetylmuramoyl-L-alanine amidase [Elusimicrobiota bacterium]|nr:N-acetylmuramoyl-L-alanine amidase [Elusimicrobiota bacterium]